MAGQEEEGTAEEKIEIDQYRFSDGQAVKEIKDEPVELKQEERPPVRSLAHVRRVFMEEYEKCMGPVVAHVQDLDVGVETENVEAEKQGCEQRHRKRLKLHSIRANIEVVKQKNPNRF
jgi:CHAD domain-containing protein